MVTAVDEADYTKKTIEAQSEGPVRLLVAGCGVVCKRPGNKLASQSQKRK